MVEVAQWGKRYRKRASRAGEAAVAPRLGKGRRSVAIDGPPDSYQRSLISTRHRHPREGGDPEARPGVM